MQDKRTAGLFHKFNVSRVDGTDAPGQRHYQCPYFVLDIAHDPHAHDAILAYAKSCEHEYPNLARDLRALYKTCEICGGSGKVHSHNDICWECDGKGWTR